MLDINTHNDIGCTGIKLTLLSLPKELEIANHSATEAQRKLNNEIYIDRRSNGVVTCRQLRLSCKNWFAVRGILYKGILARSPWCSRRRRTDETDINTSVAID